MPDLTISVTDEDLERLAEIGEPLGKNARRVAESMLHRNLVRKGTTEPTTNRQRAADRALRQVELTQKLKGQPIATLGQAEKQQLAKEFGVTERTIYRDLLVVERALDLPRQRRLRKARETRAETRAKARAS